MMKRDFKTYFTYAWVKYVITMIAAILFWSWCTNLIIRPKANEKVNIFIGSEEMNLGYLQAYKHDLGLKEINLTAYHPDSEFFRMVLETNGLIDTDLLILNLDSFNHAESLFWFMEIDPNRMDIFSEVEYFYYQDKAYGIKLTEGTYLFFNRKSVNLGKMNTNAKFEDDSAIKIAKLIIERGKGNV